MLFRETPLNRSHTQSRIPYIYTIQHNSFQLGSPTGGYLRDTIKIYHYTRRLKYKIFKLLHSSINITYIYFNKLDLNYCYIFNISIFIDLSFLENKYRNPKNWNVQSDHFSISYPFFYPFIFNLIELPIQTTIIIGIDFH